MVISVFSDPKRDPRDPNNGYEDFPVKTLTLMNGVPRRYEKVNVNKIYNLNQYEDFLKLKNDIIFGTSNKSIYTLQLFEKLLFSIVSVLISVSIFICTICYITFYKGPVLNPYSICISVITALFILIHYCYNKCFYYDSNYEMYHLDFNKYNLRIYKKTNMISLTQYMLLIENYKNETVLKEIFNMVIKKNYGFSNKFNPSPSYKPQWLLEYVSKNNLDFYETRMLVIAIFNIKDYFSNKEDIFKVSNVKYDDHSKKQIKYINIKLIDWIRAITVISVISSSVVLQVFLIWNNIF